MTGDRLPSTDVEGFPVLAGRTPLRCPDAAGHTPSPDDYLVWHAWAEDMDRTHRQQKCPGCGHWVIWVPR